MQRHWKLITMPFLVFLTLYHGASVLELGVATDLLQHALTLISVSPQWAAGISRLTFLILCVVLFAFSLDLILEERYEIPMRDARLRKRTRCKKPK